jgi:hypothetical protein
MVSRDVWRRGTLAYRVYNSYWLASHFRCILSPPPAFVSGLVPGQGLSIRDDYRHARDRSGLSPYFPGLREILLKEILYSFLPSHQPIRGWRVSPVRFSLH